MNRVVWITGGSSGIGAALVKKYSDSGYYVIATARSKGQLEKVASSSNYPENIKIFPADLEKVNELCEIPSQQEDEIPWVQRPMVESFVQKFDEPAEEFKIGGYPFVYDWGFDTSTGITTVRDIDAPTIVSDRRCEILPNFVLRCATCDCFQDKTQGYFAGPACQACSFGYATSTCKKRCPGYDGVRVETVCSGNGVCNMGIDGTGRCLCGGMGGMSSVGGTMPLYKDVDIRPREAESQWCAVWSNNVEKCEKQPYCWMDGESCRPTHDKNSIPLISLFFAKSETFLSNIDAPTSIVSFANNLISANLELSLITTPFTPESLIKVLEPAPKICTL